MPEFCRTAHHRRTYASLAPVRTIPLPDGSCLTLRVRDSRAYGVVWAVAVRREGHLVARFTMSHADGAMRAVSRKAEATAALWQVRVGRTERGADLALVCLAALALTSHGRMGSPRPGSVLEFPVPVDDDGVDAGWTGHLASAVVAAGLPGSVIHSARGYDVLVAVQPAVPLVRLADALVGNAPLPAYALPTAEAVLQDLDRAYLTPVPPHGQEWRERLLCLLAARGHLSHAAAEGWVTGMANAEWKYQQRSMARTVWNNTPAAADTDPRPHLREFQVSRDPRGLVWWLLFLCPEATWLQALPWALEEASDLVDVLVRAAPPTAIAALSAAQLARVLHEVSAEAREHLLLSLGAPTGR